jgi:hypothetical protein
MISLVEKRGVLMATQAKPTPEQNVRQTEAEQAKVASMDSAVSAAFVAAGIGSVVLGIFVVLNETSPAINSFLRWVGPVGPLSGKVGLSVIAFVVSWVGLHFAFRDRAVKLTTMFTISLVLIAIGVALTFPPVFLFLHRVFVGG